METYARHVIYRRWPGDQLRPHLSVATLREAVEYVDATIEGAGTTAQWEYEIRDLEHIEMGDMLTAADCGETVARFRAEANA